MNKIREIIKSIFFHSAKRTFYAVTVILLAVALPVTLFVVRQQQDIRQSAASSCPVCTAPNVCLTDGSGNYWCGIDPWNPPEPTIPPPTPGDGGGSGGGTQLTSTPVPTSADCPTPGTHKSLCGGNAWLCCLDGYECSYSTYLQYYCKSSSTSQSPTPTPSPTPLPTSTPIPNATATPRPTNTPTPSSTNKMSDLRVSSISRVPNTYIVGNETTLTYKVVLQNTSTSTWQGNFWLAGYYNYPSNTLNDAINCVSNPQNTKVNDIYYDCNLSAGQPFSQQYTGISIPPGATKEVIVPATGNWQFANIFNLDVYFIVRLFDLNGTSTQVQYTYGAKYYRYTISPTSFATNTPTSIPTATFTPVPSCPTRSIGDANCNGSVELSDYAIWWNQTKSYNPTTLSDADFNDDNAVNQADYTIWYTSMNNNLR